jgi:hypothetical protein
MWFIHTRAARERMAVHIKRTTDMASASHKQITTELKQSNAPTLSTTSIVLQSYCNGHEQLLLLLLLLPTESDAACLTHGGVAHSPHVPEVFKAFAEVVVGAKQVHRPPHCRQQFNLHHLRAGGGGVGRRCECKAMLPSHSSARACAHDHHMHVLLPTHEPTLKFMPCADTRPPQRAHQP